MAKRTRSLSTGNYSLTKFRTNYEMHTVYSLTACNYSCTHRKGLKTLRSLKKNLKTHLLSLSQSAWSFLSSFVIHYSVPRAGRLATATLCQHYIKAPLFYLYFKRITLCLVLCYFVHCYYAHALRICFRTFKNINPGSLYVLLYPQ